MMRRYHFIKKQERGCSLRNSLLAFFFKILFCCDIDNGFGKINGFDIADYGLLLAENGDKGQFIAFLFKIGNALSKSLIFVMIDINFGKTHNYSPFDARSNAA